VAQAERRVKRVALGTGKTVEPTQKRRAKLVQASERELSRELDAGRSRDATARRPLNHVFQYPYSHTDRDRDAGGRRHARLRSFTHRIAVAKFHGERDILAAPGLQATGLSPDPPLR
jgi:hypothetical protein